MTPYDEYILINSIGFIGCIVCFTCLLQSTRRRGETVHIEEPVIQHIAIKLNKEDNVIKI